MAENGTTFSYVTFRAVDIEGEECESTFSLRKGDSISVGSIMVKIDEVFYVGYDVVEHWRLDGLNGVHEESKACDDRPDGQPPCQFLYREA